MTPEQAAEIIKWGTKRPSRFVDLNVKFGKLKQAWVYDHELQTGQFVNDVTEINLVQKRTNDRRTLYEELRSEFA